MIDLTRSRKQAAEADAIFGHPAVQAVTEQVRALAAEVERLQGTQQQDHSALLRMLAHRARCFPSYPLGYHIPEVFAAIGEEPPWPSDASAAGLAQQAGERERFEAWAKTKNISLERWVVNEEMYEDPEAIGAWSAWQARAALSAPASAQEEVQALVPAPEPTDEACKWVNDFFSANGFYPSPAQCYVAGKTASPTVAQNTPAPAQAPQAEPVAQGMTMDQAYDAVKEAGLDWQRGWAGDPLEVNRYVKLIRIVERAHGIGAEQGEQKP